jgi:hypothetical protein
MDITDLSDTIIPKSDQLNAEQLLAGPIVITITRVDRVSAPDQPVVIHYEGENGRPYKPCLTMRKLLVSAWGKDGRVWIGRSIQLYRDPSVKWAGEAVGGIRISHATDIPHMLEIRLTSTRGKYSVHRLLPLVLEVPADPKEAAMRELENAADCGLSVLTQKWKGIGKAMRQQIGGPESVCPQALKDRAKKADEDRAKAQVAADQNAATTAALAALVQEPQPATVATTHDAAPNSPPEGADPADPLADVAL